MKPVAAEFATPSRPDVWHWAFLGVLVVVAATLTVRAEMARRELQNLERDIASLKAQLAAAHQAPASAPLPPYYDSALEMLRETDPMWIEVLTALELVEELGVAVTSINIPSPGSPAIIQVNARDYESLLKYLAALNGTAEPEVGAVRFELQQAKLDGAGAQVVAMLNAARVKGPAIGEAGR